MAGGGRFLRGRLVGPRLRGIFWQHDGVAFRGLVFPLPFIVGLWLRFISGKPPASGRPVMDPAVPGPDLREVQGIGESRVEAFGAELLALLSAMAGEGAVEPEEPAVRKAPADAR